MVAKLPLEGLELVSCAKANAKYGSAEAAMQCGYGEDVETFEASLRNACDAAGVNIDQLSDLITPQQFRLEQGGIEVSPRNLEDDL